MDVTQLMYLITVRYHLLLKIYAQKKIFLPLYTSTHVYMCIYT